MKCELFLLTVTIYDPQRSIPECNGFIATLLIFAAYTAFVKRSGNGKITVSCHHSRKSDSRFCRRLAVSQKFDPRLTADSNDTAENRLWSLFCSNKLFTRSNLKCQRNNIVAVQREGIYSKRMPCICIFHLATQAFSGSARLSKNLFQSVPVTVKLYFITVDVYRTT